MKHISIQDHKEDFPNKISCRSINPSKSYNEKISESILDKINTKIVSLTNVNHWKKLGYRMVKTILNKDQYSFVMFDIESFYFSVSLELYNEVLNFAKALTDIGVNLHSIVCRNVTELFA